MAKKIIYQTLSIPLNGASTADVDIEVGSGNIQVNHLPGQNQDLVNGTLQYLENQNAPSSSVDMKGNHANLTIKANHSKQRWSRLPWVACNGATDWQININEAVTTGLLVHSGGGNITLDLQENSLSGVSADTGGGNVDVQLPAKSMSLAVKATSGAGNVTVEMGVDTKGTNSIQAESGTGNVTVSVPDHIAASIEAKSGLGKLIINDRFLKKDENLFQSPNFESASEKVEITVKSGAGNVIVN